MRICVNGENREATAEEEKELLERKREIKIVFDRKRQIEKAREDAITSSKEKLIGLGFTKSESDLFF